jgi:hypothetical protein
MSVLRAVTRRQVLSAALAAPALPISFNAPHRAFTLPDEKHFLSRESHAGFATLFASEAVHHSRNSIVLRAGIRKLAPSDARDLRDQAEKGAWIILEPAFAFYGDSEAARGSAQLARLLEVQVGPPQPVHAPSPRKPAYIRYRWPASQHVRPFGFVTPIRCSAFETIATLGEVPVCARFARGRGGFIYLGSMLGPNLFAEEREAHALGRALLRALS